MLTREISSWPLEAKIHIHVRACNILYDWSTVATVKNSGLLSLSLCSKLLHNIMAALYFYILIVITAFYSFVERPYLFRFVGILDTAQLLLHLRLCWHKSTCTRLYIYKSKQDHDIFVLYLYWDIYKGQLCLNHNIACDWSITATCSHITAFKLRNFPWFELKF